MCWFIGGQIRKIRYSIRLFLCWFGLSCTLLSGCAGITKTGWGARINNLISSTIENKAKRDCPLSEPSWVKPPADAAVDGTPEYSFYYVNPDSSIWASAWWIEHEEEYLRAGAEGIKTGWFRPQGVDLEITGQRLDKQAAPLDAHIPCCSPTRFQASGLYFPTGGCWEVTASAELSELSFILWLEP